MSTLKVNNIQNANGTDAISIGSDGSLSYPNIGRRNLILNGAMQVAQRGTQVTGVTTAGFRTVDRTKFAVATLGTWTVDQSTDAPSGFSYSLKGTCTTADASPSASANLSILQEIEAQDLQHLDYGASSAKTMTISFWVKSNKTGTASFEVYQNDAGRLLSPTYSINSADTWEYKTISIPADTSGQIDNNNDAGLGLRWWLNSGSNFTGGTNATSWATSSNPNRNASNLGVGGTLSDYFAITGVQLEVGSVATPFEHRSYGEELALCQRYFYKNTDTVGTFDGSYGKKSGISTTYAYNAHGTFPVTMRAEPTAIVDISGATYENSSSYQLIAGTAGYLVRVTSSSSSAYRFYEWTATFDAEL